MRARASTRAIAVSVAAVTLAAMAGCASPAGGDTPVRLVVRDSHLRAEGEDCAGARPYQDVHRGSVVDLIDDDGAVIGSATLPTGTAERFDDLDYGKAPRIPTFCVFDLPGLAVPAEGTYTVEIDGVEASELRVAAGDAGSDDDPLLISIPDLGVVGSD